MQFFLGPLTQKAAHDRRAVEAARIAVPIKYGALISIDLERDLRLSGIARHGSGLRASGDGSHAKEPVKTAGLRLERADRDAFDLELPVVWRVFPPCADGVLSAPQDLCEANLGAEVLDGFGGFHPNSIAHSISDTQMLSKAEAENQSMETVGQRIKRLRLERGMLRQMMLAEPVGITQSTLSDIESKNKDFSATVLYAFAKELDVSCDEIMYGTQGEIVGQSELLRIFSELSPAQREVVLDMVRGLGVANKTNASVA